VVGCWGFYADAAIDCQLQRPVVRSMWERERKQGGGERGLHTAQQVQSEWLGVGSMLMLQQVAGVASCF